MTREEPAAFYLMIWSLAAGWVEFCCWRGLRIRRSSEFSNRYAFGFAYVALRSTFPLLRYSRNTLFVGTITSESFLSALEEHRSPHVWRRSASKMGESDGYEVLQAQAPRVLDSNATVAQDRYRIRSRHQLLLGTAVPCPLGEASRFAREHVPELTFHSGLSLLRCTSSATHELAVSHVNAPVPGQR